MCEYHLNVGDMFRTPHGLGLIIDKKNSKFHYTTVSRTDGGDLAIGVSQILTESFYEAINTGGVEAVYMIDRKYRRKRK
jgi:hypothetical protein